MLAKTKYNKIFFLIIAVLFITIGIYGARRQNLLSQLPVSVNKENNYFIIKKVHIDYSQKSVPISTGDTLLAIENSIVKNPLLIKKIADTKKAGTKISLTILKNNKPFTTSVALTPKYKSYFIILNITIALLFSIIGIFVYFVKTEVTAARIFGWTTLLASTTILIFWRNYPYFNQPLEYFLSAFYLLIYSLLPAFLLYFTASYPYKAKFLTKGYSPLTTIFTPGVVIAILLEIKYFTFIKSNSLNDFADYISTYNVFRAYLIVYIFLSMLSLAMANKNAATHNDKKKVQWILWALVLGISPFLFLWTLFLSLGVNPIYSEFVNYPFMLIIPVGIAISIVKFKTFDIEVVINKSIVYSLLTGLIIFTYLAITFLISLVAQIKRPDPYNLLTIIFTLTIAFFLIPLKEKMQAFVDKLFYRTKYDYRIMRDDFSKLITEACNVDTLTNLTLKKIKSYFQIDKIMLMLPDAFTNKLCISKQIGFTPREKKFVTIDTTGKASPGKTGVHLTIPVTLDHSLAGLLLIGKKLSERPFSELEVNQMYHLLRDSLIALDRLRLRQAMLIEQAENKRLQEINALKSEFISHVSHELITPVAAINWSTSLMLRGVPEKLSPKIREYVINVKESVTHLKSMIETLLDITKIEAGKIGISPVPLNLLNEVNHVLLILSPGLETKKLKPKINIENSLTLLADKTSLIRIMTNLIDNAIKFSDNETSIIISAEKTKKGKISISVTNHGTTIPEDRIDSIFDKFSQVQNNDQKNKGLGLGLYMTKKLIELHGGTITVTSKHNITTFKLLLKANN